MRWPTLRVPSGCTKAMRFCAARVRHVFLRHLMATIENTTDDPSARGALTSEGFEVGQLAKATAAGAAVSRMAARFAAGDDALAVLVRERQDATERWRKLDGALVKAASRPPGERDKAGEAAMRQELSALDDRIKGIDTRLATAFPQFAELSAPQPVPLVEAQALLAGRDVVTPDDVKELAYATLGHRLIVSPSARVKDVSPAQIVEDCLGRVPVPGTRPGGEARPGGQARTPGSQPVR